MSATSLDLTVCQGESFEYDVTVYSDAALTTPFDLTGYSAAAQVREAKDPDSDLVFSFTATVLSPATDGVVRLSLLPATTADLDNPPTRLFYDLEASSGVDTVYRVVQGIVTFDREVTV